jgi:ligand-binding sensor domain-containing protein
LGWGFISQFFQDAQGNIWCATNGSIDCYNGKSWRKFDANDGIDMQWLFSVSSIAQDKDGNIWFGTLYSKPMATLLPGVTYPPDYNEQPEGGIYRYDGKSWQKFTTKDGLVNNSVRAMVEDNQGNLWFGTEQGVSRYDGTNWKTFTQTEGVANNAIQFIFKDTTGDLWFSTDGGLSRFDGTSWQSFSLSGMNDIMSRIAEDGKGNFWFGGNGVLRFDGQSWQSITTENGLPSMLVYSLATDQDGNLWLGTQEGLVHFDGTKWQTFTIMDGLEFNNISIILVDRNGNIWCETAYGLARYTPNQP